MWTTCFRKIGRLNFHNGKSIPVSTTYQNRDPVTISIGFNSCIRYKSSKPEAKKDFYKVLGVTKHATKDEIKRNFRELAKKYHPDLNKEATAESKFKEVSEAHEILSDDHKRKMYDSYGHDGVDPDFEEGGFGGFGGFHDMPTEFIDLSDIFGHSKSSRKKKGGSNWEEEIAMEELLMMMQGMSGMGGGFDMGINNSGRGKKSKKGNRYSADEVEFMSFMSEVDPFFNSGGSGPKKGKKTGPGGRAKKPKKY